MTQKNNTLAIGSFVAGAVILLFSLLLFFSGGNYFTDKERVVMYFDGSVQGLQVGAPIKLKGVEIGEIVNIEVSFLADDLTIVNIVTGDIVLKRINRTDQQPTNNVIDAVINKGLRAQLNYQSFLTGLLYVELDFYPNTEIRLLNLQSQYREFPTIGTDLESIFNNIENLDLEAISTNFSSALGSLDSLLKSGKIDSAVNDFSAASQAVAELSKELSASVETFNALLDQTNKEIPRLSDDIALTLTELRETLNGIDGVMATAGDTFSEDSMLIDQITRSAEEVSRAASAVRVLSDTLEQQPEAILRGKQRR